MSNDVAGPDGSALSEGLGPLPEPAIRFVEDENGVSVYPDYYDANQMRAYAMQERTAERERIAAKLKQMDAEEGLHNYYGHAAWVLFGKA